MEIIEKFLCDRKHLIETYPEWKEVYIDKVEEKKVLTLPNPQLLSGFTGYLKYQLRKQGNVFIRGEKNFHKQNIPSLFRSDCEITQEDIEKRIKVFEELVDSIPKLFKSERFKREDVSPLLQHYSIYSYWIDLVDNIFVAWWFAFFENDNEYGYIKFFIDKANGEKLRTYDLRERHSSLSLRLHCQHGISATRYTSKWTPENRDLSDFLVATVRLPLKSTDFKNGIFSKEYMFPNERLDNTLKLFKKNKFTNKLEKILTSYGLDKHFLGRIK